MSILNKTHKMISQFTTALGVKCVNIFDNKELVSIAYMSTMCKYASNGPDIGQRERQMFYLTTHSTHFIYGYMASDIWLRTILIVIKETRCNHIGYSYRLAARVLLYAPSHSLCYTSRGALAGTRRHWT